MVQRRLIAHLRGSLWFVPVLCVLAGAAISFATIARVAPIDDQLELIGAAARSAMDDERDASTALTLDGQGIGVEAAERVDGRRP
jgi:hypothetical protein